MAIFNVPREGALNMPGLNELQVTGNIWYPACSWEVGRTQKYEGRVGRAGKACCSDS
jgi:hypothetical protein